MRWLHVVALMGFFGCGSGGSTGGTTGVPIGTYELKVKPVSGACLISGIQTKEYGFTATLSRSVDGGRTFFSDGTETYDAGFDGQFASYGQTVVGTFGLVDGGSCAPCEMKYTQSGNFALLSPSQNAAAGDMCPANPLTGGVTTDEDAGVVAPQPAADGGYDAVRMCGEIAVRVTGEGINCDPNCYACTANYRVTGTKR